MEFSINEIKQILDNYDDQADILDYLQQHKEAIEAKIRNYKNIVLALDNDHPLLLSADLPDLSLSWC